MRSPAVTALALRVADAARAIGFIYEGLTASRDPDSASRYLLLADRQGQRWEVRVSDHCCRARAALTRPNYDLVARPEEVGQALVAVTAWLERVQAGLVAWHDPFAGQKPRRRR